MKALIITPYTGDGISVSTAIRPLLVDFVPAAQHADLTGNPLVGGIPAVNLLVIEADVTPQQLAAVKGDNRFFVLEPGAGYNGNALVTWLNGKGAGGAGVSSADSPAAVQQKLVTFFKQAQPA